LLDTRVGIESRGVPRVPGARAKIEKAPLKQSLNKFL